MEVKAPLKNESTILDARRRLENLLEEKRLREELGDFDDFDD
ncbi:PA3496 family putative envelope integrity protein [Enterococcus faecium]